MKKSANKKEKTQIKPINCLKYLYYFLLPLPFGVISYSAFAVYSVATINTIKGSGPRFIGDDNNDDSEVNPFIEFDLFGLKFNNNEYFEQTPLLYGLFEAGYSPLTTTPNDLYRSSSSSNKLTLALGVPAPESIYSLSHGNDAVVPTVISEKSTNSVQLYWTEYHTAARTSDTLMTPLDDKYTQLTFCRLRTYNIEPILMIEGDIDLNIKYGDPHSQSYPDPTIGATTKPNRLWNIHPMFGMCGVAPAFNITSDYMEDKYIAPNSGAIWDKSTRHPITNNNTPGYGFLAQKNGVNFPTTGVNNLRFRFKGIDSFVDDLRFFVNGQLNSATVDGVTISISTDSYGKLVTLTGPIAIDGRAPSYKNDPCTFTIIAKDYNGQIIINYPFTINKWFVIVHEKTMYARHESVCNNLAGSGKYSLPLVSDLTNDNAYGLGATPHSTSPGNFQRLIGAGFFSEWGGVIDSIYNQDYMTSQKDPTNADNQIFVRNRTGQNSSMKVSSTATIAKTLCIANP